MPRQRWSSAKILIGNAKQSTTTSEMLTMQSRNSIVSTNLFSYNIQLLLIVILWIKPPLTSPRANMWCLRPQYKQYLSRRLSHSMLRLWSSDWLESVQSHQRQLMTSLSQHWMKYFSFYFLFPRVWRETEEPQPQSSVLYNLRYSHLSSVKKNFCGINLEKYIFYVSLFHSKH